MKKFIAGILAVLYLATSTGATIHVHYCMGELANWGFGNKTSKTCGNCGMEVSAQKDNNCCKDNHIFVKDDTTKKLAENNLQLLPFSSIVQPVGFAMLIEPSVQTITEEYPNCNAPPRTRPVPVYIQHCVFRI